MGYRSDVYIKVVNEKAQELLDVIQVRDMTGNANISKDEEFTYIKFEYVKWYGGYPDVDAINSKVRELKDNAGLIAIGEDYQAEIVGQPDSVEMYPCTYVDGFLEERDM